MDRSPPSRSCLGRPPRSGRALVQVALPVEVWTWLAESRQSISDAGRRLKLRGRCGQNNFRKIDFGDTATLPNGAGNGLPLKCFDLNFSWRRATIVAVQRLCLRLP